MSTSILNEDCDIYKDLPATLNVVHEEENKILKEKIKVLEKQLQAAEKEKQCLNERCAQVQRNISSLYKTALTEVNRKKRTIDDLRTQLENSVFRRNKRRRSESPVYKKAKTEVSCSGDGRKRKKFSDRDEKSSADVYVTGPIDKLKSISNDSATVAVAVQDAPIPSSRVNNNAFSTTAQQLSGSKRLVKLPETSCTLYTRRLLNRAAAGQRKDQFLSVENKPEPKCSNSDVDSNEAAFPKQVVSMLESVKMKHKHTTEELKPISEPQDSSVKQEFTSEDAKPICQPCHSSEAVHETHKSRKDASEKHDLDCVAVGVGASSERSCKRTTQALESHVKVEHDNSVTPLPEFRRRRTAKVISVSSGNKVIFGNSVSSTGGRNEEVKLNHTSENLSDLKSGKTSWQSRIDDSALKRCSLPLKKASNSVVKFPESSRMSDVRCNENVICLSSDSDDSEDYRKLKNISTEQEKKCAVKVSRNECADMNIDSVEEMKPLHSVSREKMYNEKSNEITSKACQAVQEQLNPAGDLDTRNISAGKKGRVASTHCQGTGETKYVTLVQRRRKPVSLGDSSFVVADTHKS